MSHSNGKVIVNTQIVGYFEYNGTCDVVLGRIYDSLEELRENWRCGDMGKCICGQEPSEVVLHTTYGSGFHWPGKACLKCKTIVEGLMPFELLQKHDWADMDQYLIPTDGCPETH